MAKNVVIIGGGASGLMAAIWASRLGAAVTVLEKNDKPGRKLLATGNGRCNFTNRYQDASCYRTGNQERASRVLEQFTEQDTEQFFEQLGIRIRSREGWLYPASEQAQSVLDLLVLEARFRKVKIKTRETAVAVEKAKNGYLVRTEGWQYPADSVIICCGSCASQIAGSDGDTLRFADQLQLASIPFSPALCPLRCKGNQFSSWAGVRVRAKITLLVENQEILTEQGKRNRSELKLIGKSKCISVGTGDLGSTASAADDDAVSRVLPSFGAHQITIFGFFHCNSRFPCLDFYLSESGFQNQQIKNGLCLLAGRIKPAFTAPDADAELFKKLFGVLFGKLFENP